MATVHPCRKDRHKYEAIAGAIAGLGRRSCVTCGSVQIDLRSHDDEISEGSFVFVVRRPTLFSLRSDTAQDEKGALSVGFGMRQRGRRR
jgi:hypothetical protein